MQIDGGKFVVTGGASMIGARVAHVLLDQGAREVVLFDNLSLNRTAGLGDLIDRPGVVLVRGDVMRLDQLVRSAQGAAGIFAIAGLLTVSIARDPQLGVSVNTQGVLNTLEAARIVGVPKVVAASSIAVYGSAVGGNSTEETPFSAIGISAARALYGLTKLAAEQLGVLYREEHGLAFAAMRFSSVYGERQHERGVNALNIVRAHESIRRGVAPHVAGTGHEAHDLLYVGDAAVAAVMAMESDRASGAYNIASGVPTSVREMVSAVIELTGSPLVPVFDESAVPEAVKSHGGRALRVEVSIDRAREHFGWAPDTSLRQGLTKLIAWLDSPCETGPPQL